MSNTRIHFFNLIFVCLFLLASQVTFAALSKEQLVVIINKQDENSIAIGEYYQQARNIPHKNLIYVSFKPKGTLSEKEFKVIYRDVLKQLHGHIEAFALTWTNPYRVGCMSITTAFATGYDASYCKKQPEDTCSPTGPSPYFNSNSQTPFLTHKIRPTMAITAKTLEQAKLLIDRGIKSDYSRPTGTAYFLKTKDKNRSVRHTLFPNLKRMKNITIQNLEQEFIKDKMDVMFYLTGLIQVPEIDSNTFLPGAIADHLTSVGGVPHSQTQMSILEWIEAGATGTYGTVIEPCNILQKFPHPAVLINHYINGDTLIEAYWKSVAWPGQGIFIGEPLAKPFAYSFFFTQ